MDLSTFIPSSDTVIVTLKHPVSGETLTKDDGTPMTVTAYAPHSKEYKAVVHALANKRIQKAQKTKKMLLTAEEIEQSALEMLVETTKDFDLQMGGKPVKFSTESATDVYQKFPWIKDQVAEAQEDYSAFLKN